MLVFLLSRQYMLLLTKLSRHGSRSALPSFKNKCCRPCFGGDYPLNLSISLSGGKETNRDSLSRGDWTGRSSACRPRVQPKGPGPVGDATYGSDSDWTGPPQVLLLNLSSMEGVRPVREWRREPDHWVAFESRVAWKCSPKQVVNSI